MHRKISGCLAAVMIIGTFGCLPASGAEIAQTIESVAESQKNAEEQSAVKAGENAKEQSAAETEDGAGAEAYQAQAIEMESLNNARQLGGYVGSDGRKVKANVLIRCGQLSDASDEDIRKLQEEYHVTNVVDFRSDPEREAAPDKEIEGAVNTWVSVKKYSQAAKNLPQDPLDQIILYAQSGGAQKSYSDIVTSEIGQKGYHDFFRILLENDEDGAVLWHCTQGKDRAGLAAVFILYALGVDEETILDDFELSNVFYADRIAYMKKEAKDRGCEEELLNEIGALVGVSREYMKDTIDLIETEYGSMDDYLHNQLGLTDDDITALRDKYLEAA